MARKKEYIDDEVIEKPWPYSGVMAMKQPLYKCLKKKWVLTSFLYTLVLVIKKVYLLKDYKMLHELFQNSSFDAEELTGV